MRATAVLDLDISVARQWSNVELLRGAVQTCALAAEVDAETVRRVALAFAELCENGIKYGSAGESHIRVHVSIEPAAAHIRVESPLAAGEGVPLPLVRALEDIEHAEAFAAKVEAIAGTDSPAGGLGLARLAHEGCRLRAEVHGDWLAVIAELSRST
jgi:hypothetical protein